MIVAGWLTDAFGARWVWGAASVVYLLGALLTVVLAPRGLEPEAEEALA
jgi:MFS family permease